MHKIALCQLENIVTQTKAKQGIIIFMVIEKVMVVFLTLFVNLIYASFFLVNSVFLYLGIYCKMGWSVKQETVESS